MKNLFLFIIATALCLPISNAQELKAFEIYDKEKNAVSFSKMIDDLADYDIVLFGEFHNNSIIHWLQLKTTQGLFRIKGKELVLGAEMFERDNQEAVNLYLSDSLDDKKLEEEARLWANFTTDYKPLLDFAKDNDLNFIATNIPRRYASIVAKKGMDSLYAIPNEEKKHIAVLPIKVDLATPGYEEMLAMMKDHPGANAMDFVSAQAVKDATMAESILQNFKKKQLFLHYNGNYHSKEYGGIYWYLKKKKKSLKIAVISGIESDHIDLPIPDDFIFTEFNIVVPADMTKTY